MFQDISGQQGHFTPEVHISTAYCCSWQHHLRTVSLIKYCDHSTRKVTSVKMSFVNIQNVNCWPCVPTGNNTTWNCHLHVSIYNTSTFDRTHRFKMLTVYLPLKHDWVMAQSHLKVSCPRTIFSSGRPLILPTDRTWGCCHLITWYHVHFSIIHESLINVDKLD